MTLGAKLKARRLKLGLSQKDLAEKTNVSQRTIQRIEKDQNSPRGYTLRILAEALETDPVVMAQTEEAEADPIKRMLFINLSVLSFLVIPFGNLIFPTLAWSKFSYYQEVDEVGRRIINGQLTWALVAYPLLALAPFIDGYAQFSFPLIFIVLIGVYAFNIFTVWRTTQQLRAGKFQVCNRAISFF